MTVGADDHGPAGAGAAELLEADVAAQGGHPRYRQQRRAGSQNKEDVIFLFLFLKKLI